MAEYLVQEETLTDIADAIREQTGDENPIMLSNFASEIASIQGGGSVNYSTTEHEIGTWIDGSTIYEKTVYNAGGVSGSIQIPHGITNLDKVISYEGFCYDDPAQSQYANGQYFPFPRISADNNNIGISGVDSTYILFTNPTAFVTRLTHIYVTIRYTKQSAQEVSP